MKSFLGVTFIGVYCTYKDKWISKLNVYIYIYPDTYIFVMQLFRTKQYFFNIIFQNIDLPPLNVIKHPPMPQCNWGVTIWLADSFTLSRLIPVIFTPLRTLSFHLEWRVTTAKSKQAEPQQHQEHSWNNRNVSGLNPLTILSESAWNKTNCTPAGIYGYQMKQSRRSKSGIFSSFELEIRIADKEDVESWRRASQRELPVSKPGA